MNTLPAASDYCNVAQDPQMREKALQRAQTQQVESDTIVDTERLLAGRKDKTKRLTMPINSHQQPQNLKVLLS